MLQHLKDMTSSFLEQSPELRRILSNTGWLTIERIIRLGVGFIVTAWLARYLGPNSFGTLNLALAIFSIWAIAGQLGLRQISVRDIVNEQRKPQEIIGTAFGLQLIGSIFVILLTISSALCFKGTSEELLKLVLILSFIASFRATDAFKYWFEARINSNKVAQVEISAFLITSLIKVFLITINAELPAFAYVLLLESILGAAGTLFIFRKQPIGLKKINFKRQAAAYLLSQSWPLIISALAVTVYMRIDQIMIGDMMSTEDVGVYSVAVKLSELWYFIPMAIASSAFPAILKHKSTDPKRYKELTVYLYRTLAIIAVAAIAIIVPFAKEIITYTFGGQYTDAIGALRIHIFGGILVILNITSSHYLVAQGLQYLITIRTVIAALTNIALNYLLIPRLGLPGAAIATIFSLLITGLLFDLTTKQLYEHFWMKLRALFFIRRPFS